MLRRMCLVVSLIVLAFMGLAGAAFAAIPILMAHENVGCVTDVVIFADPPGFGPVDHAAVASNAPNNTCGKPG
jgi:hypothetical protein